MHEQFSTQNQHPYEDGHQETSNTTPETQNTSDINSATIATLKEQIKNQEEIIRLANELREQKKINPSPTSRFSDTYDNTIEDENLALFNNGLEKLKNLTNKQKMQLGGILASLGLVAFGGPLVYEKLTNNEPNPTEYTSESNLTPPQPPTPTPGGVQTPTIIETESSNYGSYPHSNEQTTTNSHNKSYPDVNEEQTDELTDHEIMLKQHNPTKSNEGFTFGGPEHIKKIQELRDKEKELGYPENSLGYENPENWQIQVIKLYQNGDGEGVYNPAAYSLENPPKVSDRIMTSQLNGFNKRVLTFPEKFNLSPEATDKFTQYINNPENSDKLFKLYLLYTDMRFDQSYNLGKEGNKLDSIVKEIISNGGDPSEVLSSVVIFRSATSFEGF